MWRSRNCEEYLTESEGVQIGSNGDEASKEAVDEVELGPKARE